MQQSQLVRHEPEFIGAWPVLAGFGLEIVEQVPIDAP